MSWASQPYPMYAQQSTAPPGWPGAPAGPPPVPAGANVNPQHWSSGQWVANPMYRGPMPGPQASFQVWAAHPAWGAQVAQAAAATQAAQHNPYKRVPNRGDADYWNTKLSDNPLGLENMHIRDDTPLEERKVKDSPNGAPHTPWVWVPKELGKQEDGEATNQRNGRNAAPPANSAPVIPPPPPQAAPPSQPSALHQQPPSHERPPRSQPHESLSRSNTQTRSNGLSRSNTLDSHARSHARETHRSPSRDPPSHHRSPSYEPRPPPDARSHTRSPPPSAIPYRWPYGARGSTTPANGSPPEHSKEERREPAKERASIYQAGLPQEASRERSSVYARDDRTDSSSRRTSYYPTDERRERTRERERTMSTRSPSARLDSDPVIPPVPPMPPVPVIPPPPERLPPGSQASYAAYQQVQQQKQQQQQQQQQHQSHSRTRSREVSPRPADNTRETRPSYPARVPATSSASASAAAAAGATRPATAAAKPKEEPFSSRGDLLPTFPHSIVRTPNHYSSATSTPRRASEEPDRAPSRAPHGSIYGPPTPTRTNSTPSRQTSGVSTASAAAAAANGVKPSPAIVTSVSNFSDEPTTLLSPLVGLPEPKTPTRISPSGREITRSQTYPTLGSPFEPIPEDRSTSQPRTPRPRDHEPASDGDRDRERRREPSTTPKHPRSPSYRSPDTSARLIARSHTYPTMDPSPQPSPSHHHSHSRSGSRSRPPSPHRQSRHVSTSASASVNPLPAPPKPIPYPYTPVSLNTSPAQRSPSRVSPVTPPRSGGQQRPSAQRRIGFWNNRGDHLLFENGRSWIVYAPRHRVVPPDLAQYPSPLEGFMDHTGRRAKYDGSIQELPDSLPSHGESPRRPYESFVQYTTVYL